MIQSDGKPGLRMGVWIGNGSWDWKKEYGLFDVDLGDSYRECKKWMIGKDREIANGSGLARVTARRYLEKMVEESKVEIYQEYGKIGRPTNYYKVK